MLIADTAVPPAAHEGASIDTCERSIGQWAKMKMMLNTVFTKHPTERRPDRSDKDSIAVLGELPKEIKRERERSYFFRTLQNKPF